MRRKLIQESLFIPFEVAVLPGSGLTTAGVVTALSSADADGTMHAALLRHNVVTSSDLRAELSTNPTVSSGASDGSDGSSGSDATGSGSDSGNGDGGGDDSSSGGGFFASISNLVSSTLDYFFGDGCTAAGNSDSDCLLMTIGFVLLSFAVCSTLWKLKLVHFFLIIYLTTSVNQK